MVRVVAEVGINHEGDMEMAEGLIRIAATCGANIAKFQLYDVDTLFPDKAIWSEGKNWYNMVKKTQLTQEQVFELAERCSEEGIEFAASAFDIKRLGWLEEIGVKRHKAGTRAARDQKLLEAMAATGKEVLISLPYGEPLGFSLQGNIKYLYCVPEYPTPLERDYLSKVSFGPKSFYGLSSHSPGIGHALTSIRMGAKLVEVHLCFTRSKVTNPDITSSVEPSELEDLVNFANQYA